MSLFNTFFAGGPVEETENDWEPSRGITTVGRTVYGQEFFCGKYNGAPLAVILPGELQSFHATSLAVSL